MRDQTTAANAVPVAAAGLAPYVPPRLSCFGTLVELTRTQNGITSPDNPPLTTTTSASTFLFDDFGRDG